jgi:hypothetical protein
MSKNFSNNFIEIKGKLLSEIEFNVSNLAQGIYNVLIFDSKKN